MNIARQIVQLALAEDVGTGDITTLTTVPADLTAHATFLAKSPGVISGLAAVALVFQEVDPTIQFNPVVVEGARVAYGDYIGTVQGPARSVLTAERVALNFLQRLSGVATATAHYVDAVAGTDVRIIDTRKTTPGMRLLEKAAVRHGGGHNHRVGLADGILIKDNHLEAIGGSSRIATAIAAARRDAPHTLRVQVEVTTLDELSQALDAGADAILLDNMDTETMAEAVRMTEGRAVLEASGGITMERLVEIAGTGVDLISVGALTHSSPALDISLEINLKTASTSASAT